MVHFVFVCSCLLYFASLSYSRVVMQRTFPREVNDKGTAKNCGTFKK